jgi:hypothetical protein
LLPWIGRALSLGPDRRETDVNRPRRLPTTRGYRQSIVDGGHIEETATLRQGGLGEYVKEIQKTQKPGRRSHCPFSSLSKLCLRFQPYPKGLPPGCGTESRISHSRTFHPLDRSPLLRAFLPRISPGFGLPPFFALIRRAPLKGSSQAQFRSQRGSSACGAKRLSSILEPADRYGIPPLRTASEGSF